MHFYLIKTAAHQVQCIFLYGAGGGIGKRTTLWM